MDKVFEDGVVQSVTADYERRRQVRRGFEAQWRLNTNFVLGNQFCCIDPCGAVSDEEKD